MRGTSKRKRELWTPVHEAERLAQLLLDVDSATERLMKQYRQACEAAPDQRDEWLRRAGQVETFRSWALPELGQFAQAMARSAQGTNPEAL